MPLDLGGWIVKTLLMCGFFYGVAKLFRLSEKLEQRKKRKKLSGQSNYKGGAISMRKK